MAENKAKSENLLNSMARIDFLIQEGFSKRKLASMAGIKYGTFQKISNGFSNGIKKQNHEKIKKLHSDYIRNQTNNELSYDDVLDDLDQKDGVKEVTSHLILFTAIIIVLVIGMFSIVRFVISLF